MHLIIDELLTEEQLNSPKRYIYEICEMYGWDVPKMVIPEGTGYRLTYTEQSEAKARKRRRLIHDACIRLGIEPIKNYTTSTGEYNLVGNIQLQTYYCHAVIPRYINKEN